MTQMPQVTTRPELASAVLDHLLEGRTWQARTMLSDTCTADLSALANAAYALMILCRCEITER